MDVLIFLAGMLVAAAAMWFYARGAARERDLLRERLEAETERRAGAEERASRVPSLEVRLTELTGQSAQLLATRAELEATLADTRRQAAEKLALVESAQQKLVETFRLASGEALQSNNQAFLVLAEQTLSRFQDRARGELDHRQKAIHEMVQPLRESLAKVDGKLHDIEVSRASAYSALCEQVKSMAAMQSQLHGETANLVRALRAPHTRGRWGELQLRRVVEMAGMLEHCDFREQPTLTTEDGRQRPDMTIQLPNRRTIVVDSKVSLAAYLDSLECKDDAARTGKLRDHASQIRTHLTKLAAKQYWQQFDQAPEFVVAFLPGEIFFSAALEQDPDLIEFGAEQKVILATPTTLIALLKAVAYGWRQERMTQNAQEISDLGRQVYDRLRIFASHLAKVGDGLDRATRSYNEAVGTLESRVLVAARRIKEKGATSAEDLPLFDPLERTSRPIQSLELMALPSDAQTL